MDAGTAAHANVHTDTAIITITITVGITADSLLSTAHSSQLTRNLLPTTTGNLPFTTLFLTPCHE